MFFHWIAYSHIEERINFCFTRASQLDVVNFALFVSNGIGSVQILVFYSVCQANIWVSYIFIVSIVPTAYWNALGEFRAMMALFEFPFSHQN